jgi:uncharacterized membrane protein YqjE
MQEDATSSTSLRAWPARFSRHLLATGGNRVELFMLELEQERRHFLEVLLLALGLATLALLAGIGITAAIVLLLWHTSPAAVLFVLAGGYGLAAVLLYRRLALVQSNWKAFPATLDQLQKDGECLKEILT